MGCRDFQREQEAEKERQDRLDLVTRLLCNVLNALETAEEPVTLTDLSTETQEWWREHKAADVKRIVADQLAVQEAKRKQEAREQALAKLSPEERQLLGVK